MNPERKAEHSMFQEIEQVAADESSQTKPELKGATESQAEELFALWQDFRRLRVDSHIKRRQHKKEHQTEDFSDPNSGKLEKIRAALSERWANPQVQAMFKKRVGEATSEWGKIKKPRKEYKDTLSELQAHSAELEGLYREVFEHRGKDPDELTQIQIAELSAQAAVNKKDLEKKERASPELSAQLSFERLKGYQKQLSKDGFIWTPSREKYFEKIIDHLVVVNQNRPLLLAGETGTGKTRLARAVSKRLTGKNPYEVGEEAKTDIRPLLGSRAIDEKGSYVTYGQLGQAVSGKETSRDIKAGQGGIFYMDEMNGYPGDALRSLVKQISGRRPGEEITFAAWAGQKENLSRNFGFLGSANLPSEKHPDRADLPVEVARELASLEIDYPPQSAEDPELYEMMLAGLMDQNGRIRVPKEELAPEYEDVVVAQEKHQRLKTDVVSGGALWRFANLVADVQKSYKGQENSLTPTLKDASHLRAAVLDPGLVLSWLAAYRKVASRRDVDLQTFLAEKLSVWSGQKIYPEEDRNLLQQFVAKFNLEAPTQPATHGHTILSPSEIGALSPRVARQPELLEEPPAPVENIEYLPDGSEIVFDDKSSQIKGGTRMTKSGDPKKEVWTFMGWGLKEHKGQAVMKNDSGEVKLIPSKEWDTKWGVVSGSFTERFEGREIKLDVREIFNSADKFYKEHNLQEFAASLPKDIKFSRDGEARIREALKMGFDKAMILPAVDVQIRSLDPLIEELATKTAKGSVPEPDQYTAPYVDSTAKASQVRNRPSKGYMLLYQSKPVPPETKGKTANELETMFKQKKWDGLTLSEYLVLQRKEFEQNKNHSFDAYSDEATDSQWTWLLDSRASSSGVVHAHWYPWARRVLLRWHGAESSSARLGARPAVVVEIL